MELRVKSKVDYLTEKQIENIANGLLEQYQEEEGEIQKPSIPVEFIVEDFLGFEIIWEEFHEKDTLAYIDPNRKEIHFNLNRPDYFDSIGSEYTMAHEIGHYRLGHFEDISKQLALGILNQPTCLLHRDNTKIQYQRREYQAEYFASCLIMPRWLIASIQEEYNLLEWKDLYTIASLFNVSITALTTRLTKLNLIYIKNKKIYNSEQEAHGMRRMF